MDKTKLVNDIKDTLLRDYGKSPKEATVNEMHNVVAKIIVIIIKINIIANNILYFFFNFI